MTAEKLFATSIHSYLWCITMRVINENEDTSSDEMQR